MQAMYGSQSNSALVSKDSKVATYYTYTLLLEWFPEEYCEYYLYFEEIDIIKGNLGEKLPSYGDLKMQRVQ